MKFQEHRVGSGRAGGELWEFLDLPTVGNSCYSLKFLGINRILQDAGQIGSWLGGYSVEAPM